MEDTTKEKLDELKAAMVSAEKGEKVDIYVEFTKLVMTDKTIDSPEKVTLLQEANKLI